MLCEDILTVFVTSLARLFIIIRHGAIRVCFW